MAAAAAPSASAPYLKKVKKSARTNVSAATGAVAQALFNIETDNKSLKTALSALHINAVKEVDIADKKKATVIFYSLRFIRKFRKIQKAVIADLEKKLKTDVVLIAQRKIQAKPKSNMARRQRSRTLTAVHDAIVEDICYPADIVGRRWHYSADGSKKMKIFFDLKVRDTTEPKLATFSTLIQKLTGRQVSFGYMSAPAFNEVA